MDESIPSTLDSMGEKVLKLHRFATPCMCLYCVQRRRGFGIGSKAFLDTSAVVYSLDVNSETKAAVEKCIDGRIAEVSNFIRMEYIRTRIINLIDIYSMIKDAPTVADALIDISQLPPFKDRALRAFVGSLSGWLLQHEDATDKSKALRRFGDLVIRMLMNFDLEFKSRSKDHLACQLGKLKFGNDRSTEDLLFDFYDRYHVIESGTPECEQCTFKAKQIRKLESQSIDICSQENCDKYRRNDGYIKQAKRIGKVLSVNRETPSCKSCRDLGDTIVTLQSPPSSLIITVDRSFEALGAIVGHEVVIVPSAVQLRKQRAGESQSIN